MAHIELTMPATGDIADEHCAGCKRAFRRSEEMSAVVYDDGESAGWFCAECLDNWNQKIGKPK